MRGLRKLIDKEWRDVRAITIASLVLMVIGTLAIRFVFLPEGHPYSAEALGGATAKWFVPSLLAVYLAVIASDLVAADASTGRMRTLALLPVPLHRVWTAKVVFLLVAGLVFGVLAGAGQMLLLLSAGRPGSVLAFLDDLPTALPHFGVAFAFSAVVLFFSTLLERGFAVGLAAVVAVAALIGTVVLVGQRYPDAAAGAVSPPQLAAIVAAIALLFAAASALTFVRGPIHASGILRRAAIGAGAVLGVLVPAGLVSAKALHDYVHFEPREPGVRIALLSVSPDGRHLVVSAGRRKTRRQHQTWIIDTETGDLVALDELGLRPAWWAPTWSDDGLYCAEATLGRADLVRWLHPATGEVARTRSLDQVRSPVAHLQPWGRGWATVNRQTVRWPERGLSCELPPGSQACVSPLPGYWVDHRADAFVLHDMAAAEECVISADPEQRSSHFSPNGDYVSVSSAAGSRIVDGRTGATVLGPLPHDMGTAWPGGGSPDRYLLTYGKSATHLHDLATGTSLKLEPDPNHHGYPPEAVRVLPDGTIAIVRQDAGTIDLLDAGGRVLRRLYAPRED